MGKYINVINGVSLPPKRKANFILAHVPDSEKIEPPAEWRDGLVCVVENGAFDAAGYAYDENEMQAFLYPTTRPRTWLIVPNAKDYAS